MATLFDLVDPEIWIVTAACGDLRGGLLATWVMQSSIDDENPTLITGLAPNHFTTTLVKRSGRFAVHLLGVHQSELAWNFARDSGRNRDKLAGLTLSSSPSSESPPVLADVPASAIAQVVYEADVGDRILFHAVVLEQKRPTKKVELLRRNHFFASLNDAQRTELRKDMTSDVELQRPMKQAWLNALSNAR